MNNFQLYRTNVLLGGQMKMDLIVDSHKSELVVSDFHLRPISNNIIYSKQFANNLLNNLHQDNVKLFYKSIQSNFYKSGLDSKYNDTYPVLCNEDEIIDAYSNIYDMGCKRIESYKLYDKQFEFFCPLWLEKIDGDIEFKISIKPVINKNLVLASKTLNISKDKLDVLTHNKFVKYFESYINDANLKNGDDTLINIEFAKNNFSIAGLNVESGLFGSKSDNVLTHNMLLTERPLMETNSMIIQSFANNNIIAKQLFNFNICFNINDLISPAIINLITDKKFVIEVDVFVNNNKLEKKDFYTNYEYINRLVSSNSEENDNFNVLDYLHDYEALDLIDKNKFNQEICHWSLAENNDYIFNVYEGFSGIKISNIDGKTTYIENEHQYRDFPNLMSSSVNDMFNFVGWLNIEYVKYWNDFYKYVINTAKNKTAGNYIYDNAFINGIKYKNISKIENKNGKGFYLIGLYSNNTMFSNIKNNLKRLKLQHVKINQDVSIIRKDDLVIILSNDIKNLTFKKLSDILYIKKNDIYEEICVSNVDDDVHNDFDKEYIDAIYSIVNNVVEPCMLKFNSGLQYVVCNGPSININEIRYVKNNEIKNYIFRYDGKLLPTFVDKPVNVLYYKDYVSNDPEKSSKLLHSKYANYIKSNFEPKYPSINYCGISKITDWKYNELPKVKVSEYKDEISVLNPVEYSWFEDNSCLFLLPEITYVYDSKKEMNNQSIVESAKNIIASKYDLTNKSEIEYVFSKYYISYDWEYAEIDNVKDYIYTITLKLK